MTDSLAKTRFALVFLFVLLSANFLMSQALKQHVDNPGQTQLDPVPDDVLHTHQGDPNRVLPAAPSGGAVVTGNGINYHNGPVLKGNPVPIYVIWYGNWTNGAKPSDSPLTKTLLEGFLGSTSLGGSGYEAINSTYGDTTGNVSGRLNFGGSVQDNYSQGSRFGDKNLLTIVSTHAGGDLPLDANGVYLVLTSSDVNETSGFCRTYCGFHTHATIKGVDIKYAFIGNVDKCQNGCEAQVTGPNSPAAGVGGADGMANVIAHETEEAITDPDLNAWFDSSGQEDADKCNFKFGPTTIVANGAHINQTFGGTSWLIQMEWENSRGGGCAQTLGGPFFTN
jgi:Phosphate-induced protein 1 conserved region